MIFSKFSHLKSKLAAEDSTLGAFGLRKMLYRGLSWRLKRDVSRLDSLFSSFRFGRWFLTIYEKKNKLKNRQKNRNTNEHKPQGRTFFFFVASSTIIKSSKKVLVRLPGPEISIAFMSSLFNRILLFSEYGNIVFT